MRLFSEKVVPTYTSSNLNILTVKDYNEVFFDVFEFEINGKKFIAEKVSGYKGSPVVDIPLVLEGKEFTASFVLQRGKFEILFNKANSTFVGPAVQEATEPIVIFKEQESEIEDIVFEKKESILKEIHQAKQSAEQYVKELKQQKLRETTKFFDDKKQILDKEISESKKSLLDEFLSLVENVKSEFYEFNESEKTRLVSFIKESIDSLSDDLSKDIEDKNEQAEKVFSEKINELATNVLSGVLLKEIDSNNKKTNKDITSRFEAITTSLNKLTEQRDSRLKGEMKEILGEYSGSLNGLEQANVELNDLINKSNNKALSRIGNVKTQLEESIQQVERELTSVNNLVDSNIRELQEKITLTEDNIITFYDERINLVETKVTDLTEENKQYFINLIEESKQTLLEQISNIKVDVPNIIIEKSNGKQEVDLKGIKSELEKIIGTRFSTELMALKRLIEMSSGGGSVAKQFANGGTMNGNLNVTGTIFKNGVDILTLIGGGGAYTLVDATSSIKPVRGSNSASGFYSSVGGGHTNAACSNSSNVAGGCCNTACNDYTNVAGGQYNTASGSYANVAGGCCNTAYGNSSNVAGGRCNIASCYYSSVAGGCCNAACGELSNIAGGIGNTASGYYSSVGGGYINAACSNYSNVAGGRSNTACACSATVGGGHTNTASGYISNIAGGCGNTVCGSFSNIAGGLCNTSSGDYTSVASIGGGMCNTICWFSPGSTIAGGYCNTASGYYSNVAGGINNIAGGGYGSTVAGGRGNTASGQYSTIAGGFSSIASGNYSSVLGGACNNVSHDNSFILGSNITSTAADTTYMNNVRAADIYSNNFKLASENFAIAMAIAIG